MRQVATALLLDDDPGFGALLAAELGRRGIRMLQARRRSEVEAVLAGIVPDVYLVDGLLPDGDGLSWIEALRARDPHTPVAFVSSFWQDLRSFDRLRNELGVGLVVRKPVVPTVFAEQIRALLPGGDTAAAPEAPLAEELRALHRAYASGLPEEVRTLAAAIGDRHPDALGRARLIAHRLRGTAGTYGLHRVSALAAELEDAIVERRATPDERAALAAPLAALERLAAEEAAAARPEQPVRPETVGRVVVLGLGALGERVGALAAAAGLGVEVATSWASGLRSARARPPDVAVLGHEGVTPEQALTLAAELHSDGGASVVLVGAGEGGLDARVAATNAGVSLALPAGAGAEAVVSAARQLVEGRVADRPAVLIVDDDPAFASHVRAMLRASGLRAEALADPRGLLDALHATRPDALLLDLIMPGFGGLDLCRMLRSMPEWQDLPILLVTAEADAETRLAGFRAGADDHVSKPVLGEELVARIAVRVERRRLLRERADRDPLTGLSSRRPFVEALESRLAEGRRHARGLSLIVLDLDRFKRINDEHGHLVGDRVLTALGGLLGRRLRREDLRCRWGGEEVAIALAEPDAEVAAGVVRQLLGDFRALEFEGAAGERFSASFSAGVAASPADGATLRALFEAADRRCYAAKAAGRARVFAADAIH